MSIFDFFKNKFKVNLSDEELINFSNFLSDSGFEHRIIEEMKAVYVSNKNLESVRNFLKLRLEKLNYNGYYFLNGDISSFFNQLDPNKKVLYIGKQKKIHENSIITDDILKNINEIETYISNDFTVFIDEKNIKNVRNIFNEKNIKYKTIQIISATKNLPDINGDFIFLTDIIDETSLGSFFSLSLDKKISILNENLDFNLIIPNNYQDII